MKKILPFLCLICCIPLAGCFDNREVSDLAILMTLGIDRTAHNQILLSGEVFKPGGISGGYQQQSTNSASTTMVITAKGNSVFSAFRQFETVLPKSLYWSHLQAIVIGEGMAKKGISHILDTFVREPKLRRNIKVFVAKGKAVDILTKPPKLDPTLGGEISKIARFSKFHSSAFARNVAEIITDLSDNTEDPFTGALTTVPSKNVKIKGTQEPNSVRLSGIAVFKGDRLIGWLGPRRATDLFWLKGKEVQKGIVTLPCKQNKHEEINFRLLDSSSRINPVFISGKPKIQVHLDTVFEMTEMNCSKFNMSDQTINRLNKRLEKKIKSHLRQTLKIVKNKWQTDPMGFGRDIYHDNPKLWRKLGPGWQKGILKNLPVSIRVSVNIRQNGLQQSSIQNREGKSP